MLLFISQLQGIRVFRKLASIPLLFIFLYLLYS